ncbi:sulfate adenylyltransferase subunit CysD [Enterobacterales bacterium endosymbiont of Anomoneura mori]|uniref:sulfate adenylyltransferase subunit CysD n=1 Tax=Enterobacterales bacterium endosymbiont of Anomoneura mori TaxID=3132096 RepID=UPI00399CEEBD
MNYNRYTHLKQLEAESINIIREVVTEFKNPVMLYSIGKDSSVMLHLSRKAFFPGKIPFPFLHVDTGWKFNEMYKFRKNTSKNYDIKLLIYKNKENNNVNPFIDGSNKYTNIMKTIGLKKAINKYKFDAAFGGARRDEEKSRAKERIFSFRDRFHRWNPKNQRPELWNNYNCQINKGENIRIFPLSNWTELDIWEYIYLENIEIVSLYFSKLRKIVKRDNMLIMLNDNRINLKSKEIPMYLMVRFRTLGCWPLTGATKSNAITLSDIIEETLFINSSERYGRAIDIDQSGSMEYKKRNGYF